VTARAVKTWLDYWLKASGYPTTGTTGVIDFPVASIETIGEWTVLMVLKKPYSLMPYQLTTPLFPSGYVVSPNAVAHPSILNTQTDGAGPYVLDPAATITGSRWTFIPNRYFYDKSQIRFRKIVVRYIPSPSSRLQALKTGEILLDMASSETSDVAAAKAAGFRVLGFPGNGYGLYFTDLGGTVLKALADVRVRQAMNYAINRKGINQAFFGAYGTPSSEAIMLTGFDPSYENYYPYDPAKARALLAAAGYKHGFTLHMTTANPDPMAVNLAQAVAANLGAVGITVKISTLTSDFGSARFPVWSCYGCSAIEVPWFYGAFFAPGGSVDWHGWKDPVLGSLIARSLTSSDPPRYWRQFMQRVVTQAYAVPVSNVDLIYLYSPRLTGLAGSAARTNIELTEIKPH
jgi:peptide/nickel transport system substrate-binding protein